MRCPDHNRELVNGACPLCGGMFLSDGNALEAMAAGASSRLKPEERPDSLAYKKVRLCPEDAVPMAPLRIDRLEAWVEKCPTCEGLWVEKSDVRTLTMLHKSKQRQQGYASLSDAEKKELAQGLAESTARETGPDLNLAGATLVAVGVPLLNKVEGGRTPWATFGFAIALTAAFAFLDAGNLGYVAGSADLWRLFTSTFAHFGFVHLLGNLGFLLVFGDAVEQKVPRWLFLPGVLLLGPLTIAVEAKVAASPGELIGGASGAVAILFGMAVLLQRQASVSMWFGKGMLVKVPLWAYGGLWMGLQTVLWYAGVPGIAWMAHLSGFALGFALGLIAVRLQPPRTE